MASAQFKRGRPPQSSGLLKPEDSRPSDDYTRRARLRDAAAFRWRACSNASAAPKGGSEGGHNGRRASPSPGRQSPVQRLVPLSQRWPLAQSAAVAQVMEKPVITPGNTLEAFDVWPDTCVWSTSVDGKGPSAEPTTTTFAVDQPGGGESNGMVMVIGWANAVPPASRSYARPMTMIWYSDTPPPLAMSMDIGE